jgi:hypothetical protein
VKRVHSAANLAEAQLIADLLARHGIEATVLNANASSIAGELPIDSALPQVWVANPAQAANARQAIETFIHARPGPPVACPRCGEENPGSFDLCWSCGSDLGR